MAVPTNTTPATATDMTGALPYTVTIAAADLNLVPNGAGYVAYCDFLTTQPKALWWKYTAQTGDTWLAFGTTYAGNGYNPKAAMWYGDSVLPALGDSAHQVCGSVSGGFYVFRGITAGTTYYFQMFSANTDDADEAVTVLSLRSVTGAIAAGSILITDDTDNFPGAVLSKTDGDILRFVTVAAGERGDVLSSGIFCLQNGHNAKAVAIYDASVALVTSYSVAPRSLLAIKSDRDSTFFVIAREGADPAHVFALSTDGTVLDTWTLPAGSSALGQAAVSRDGNTLWWMVSSGALATVHAYDLAGSAALPDLNAGTVGWTGGGNGEGGVDASGYIYFTVTVSGSATIKRYNSTTGAVDTTYIVEDGTWNQLDRFFVPDDGSGKFWARIDGTGQAEYTRFKQVRISDGVITTAFSVAYTGTSGESTIADDPYVISNSCPLLVFPASVIVVDDDVTVVCADNTLVLTGHGLDTYSDVDVTGPDGDAVDFTVTSVTDTEMVITLTVAMTAGGYCVTVDDLDPVCATASCAGETFPICRKIRFPLPFNQNMLMFLYRLEFELQSGVSNNASITIRLSRDGGYTWPITRTLTAGALGAYDWRVYSTNFGQGRNWVCEFITDEPAFWALIQCCADMEQGTS